MRDLDAKRITQLKAVIRLKGDSLKSEVALIHREIDALDMQIESLRTPVSYDTTVESLAAISRWQTWRQEELSQINTAKATLRVEIERLEKEVSRASSEERVFDTLQKRSLQKQKASYESAFHTDYLLQFLTNDVRDQDI